MTTTLTPAERVLRAVMIDRARTAAAGDPCLTYTELGEEARKREMPGTYPMTNKPFRGMGEALGNIVRYEHALGRPLLTSLIVQQGSRRPGEGFIRLAEHLGRDVSAGEETFWRAEVAAVVEFWQDDDPTRISDAAFAKVLDELTRLRRDL
jgi:hypothetical protein